MRSHGALFVVIAAVASGCGDGGGATPDASAPFDGRRDGGDPGDAAVEADAEPGQDAGIDAGPPPDAGSPDEDPPEVLSVDPVEGESDVEPLATISVSFSEPMDPASLQDAFVVRVGSDLVAGAVSYDASSRTATFTPSARLPLRAGVSAEVTTAARDDGGTNLATAHTWSFTVRDGAWQSAVTLHDPADGFVARPWVAADRVGQAMIVWGQYDDGENTVWSVHYDDDWRTPVMLAPGDATEARVAAGPDGHFVAAWRRDLGATADVAARFFRPGAGWTSPTTLDDSDPPEIGRLEVAYSRNGDAMVIWDQPWLYGDGTDEIRTRRWSGTAWEPSTLLTTYDGTEYDAYDPHLSGNADGAFAALFTVPPSRVWGNVFEPGAGWGTSTSMPGDQELYSHARGIGVAADGTAIAVWSHRLTGVQGEVVASRWDGDSWTTTRISPEGENARSPGIAVLPSGEAMVVWTQETDGGADSLLARRYVPDSGWEAPVVIQPDAGFTMFADVVANDRGEMVVAWARQEDIYSVSNVYAARYVPGQEWTPPHLVENGAANAYQPHAAIDGTGVVTVTWAQGNSGVTNLWAARFE